MIEIKSSRFLQAVELRLLEKVREQVEDGETLTPAMVGEAMRETLHSWRKLADRMLRDDDLFYSVARQLHKELNY